MRPTVPSFIRVLVPIKRTVDYAVKIRVGPKGVETNGVKHSLVSLDYMLSKRGARRSSLQSFRCACELTPLARRDRIPSARSVGHHSPYCFVIRQECDQPPLSRPD